MSGITERLNYPQLGLLILAWFIVDLITPLIIHLCHKIGAVDRPGGYKMHKEPTPFLGGLAIYIGYSIAIFSILRFESFQANRALFGIIFGGFGVVILGCIDGFKPLSGATKLFILLLATFIISNFGVRISIFGNQFLDVALTLIWIVGVTSALNSLDNIDGASAGISAIASFFTFYVAWYSHPPQRALSYMTIALLGASLGFLRYNFKPAKIFLGDNGSLLLGFLLASMSVLGGWAKADTLKAIIIPCAILTIPLYDITLSTILRYKNKIVKNFYEAIVYCGRDHISHRLVALGLTERESVMLLYLGGVLSGAVGAVIANENVGVSIYLPITILSIMIMIVAGIFLDKAKVYDKSLK